MFFFCRPPKEEKDKNDDDDDDDDDDYHRQIRFDQRFGWFISTSHQVLPLIESTTVSNQTSFD